MMTAQAAYDSILEQMGTDDPFEVSDAMVGMCLACGELADGVEPDARRYECECCGAHKVYGFEEIAMHCVA